MAFSTNQFCWHGCISTDLDAVKNFYPAVLGWSVENLPMGDSEATFFSAQGKNLAHLAPPSTDGIPSHWNNYFRVEDVDQCAAAAESNGGKQLSPAADIPPGRYCDMASPSGAIFTLFRESDPASENHPGGDGSVHWVELHSKDVDADLAWLVATFGFETEQMAMPDGAYTILKSGDTPCGGVMASQHEQAPSMWLTWFRVPELDNKLLVVEEHGGSILTPAFDVPNIGRMAIVKDSSGGVLGLITPAS